MQLERKAPSPAGRAFAALGRSILYLLFYLGIQLVVGVVYFVALVGDLVLNYGELGSEALAQLLLQRSTAQAEVISVIALAAVAGALVLWFLLRRKPLGEAAGIRRCSGWTVGFCAFAAIGFYVIVSVALSLLPAAWLADYEQAMAQVDHFNGLAAILHTVIAAPAVEELVFRGVIQSRLERAMPTWAAVVIQAALFGLVHGQPIQIGYAFVIGLAYGWMRHRAGSILPVVAAHMVFNGMNIPLNVLAGESNGWYVYAGMAVVCAAGCVLCRKGLAQMLVKPAPAPASPHVP